MHEGTKRERAPHRPRGAEDDAEARAKLLELTQRAAFLQKEIAELEDVVTRGIKPEPAGGAYDSANEELAHAIEEQYKSLVDMKKGELRFVKLQLEDFKQA